MRESWLNENQRLVSQVPGPGLVDKVGGQVGGWMGELVALGPEKETWSPKQQRSVGLVS